MVDELTHHDRTFLCNCQYPGHQFTVYRDDGFKEIFVSVSLTPSSFWLRLKFAWVYVFGRGSHGGWAEIVLEPSDADRLIAVLQKLRAPLTPEEAK